MVEVCLRKLRFEKDGFAATLQGRLILLKNVLNYATVAVGLAYSGLSRMALS